MNILSTKFNFDNDTNMIIYENLSEMKFNQHESKFHMI